MMTRTFGMLVLAALLVSPAGAAADMAARKLKLQRQMIELQMAELELEMAGLEPAAAAAPAGKPAAAAEKPAEKPAGCSGHSDCAATEYCDTHRECSGCTFHHANKSIGTCQSANGPIGGACPSHCVSAKTAATAAEEEEDAAEDDLEMSTAVTVVRVAQGVTTEAFRGWQALLETSPADETLAAAAAATAAAAGQADVEHIHKAIKLFAGERCILKSRMAGVSSYQQGLAGIEFVDFSHSDEAAFDAEYEAEAEAEAMEELTAFERWEDDDEEVEEEVAAAGDESREILELAEMTGATTDSPTTATALTPEVAQTPNATRPEAEEGPGPAPAVGTENSTAATTIKARARAALARAKAADRARKQAKRAAAAAPAVATVTTTATVTAKASAGNTAPRRAGRGRDRDRDRSNRNHSTVTATFSAATAAGNQSAKDVDGDEGLPVPVATLHGGRRGRLTPAGSSHGSAAADEAGFATGFLYTLGTVGVVVAVIVAGVGITVYANDLDAQAASSSRRVSLAPSLAPSLLSAGADSAMGTALGVGFGSLQRRPAAGAGRRCSESLPL